jgi:hypothetical protein
MWIRKKLQKRLGNSLTSPGKCQLYVNVFNVRNVDNSSFSIFSPAIKNSWRSNLSASQNLKVMGLVYDSNKSLPVSSKTPRVKFCCKNYAVVHVRNFNLLFRHLKCQSLLLL